MPSGLTTRMSAPCAQTCCNKSAPAFVIAPVSPETPPARICESTSACLAQKAVDSPLCDFSIEDKASMDVYHTKEVTVNHGVLDTQGFIDDFHWVRERADTAAKGANIALQAHEMLNRAKKILAYQGTDDDDFTSNLLARLEDFVSLILGLASASNVTTYFSLVHLYCRTHFRGSVLKFVYSHLLELNGLTQKPDGSLDTQGADFESFLSMSRESINSWKSHKSSEFARRITDMISVLVACGFLGEEDMTEVKLGHLKLFKLRAFDKQLESVDFFEMVFDTVLFFVERGYAAIKEGDISLLLHSDKEAAYIDCEYTTIVAALPLLEAGRLDSLPGEFANDQDYDSRLEKLIFTITSAVKATKDGPAKTVLTNKLLVLKKVRTTLVMAQKQSPIREKPYGVAIFGGSSVGKSTINAILMKVVLAANDFPSTKEFIVTLNDNDKYQSEYKGCHTGVTMDDHGNTRSEHYSESPCNKIIDFLNNVQKAALNPNVELKGNIMIRPKVVTLTTNVKELLANTFSNEPVSILRRFNVHLDVRLKPEFVDPETGGLNSAMVNSYIPDAWFIDVQRVLIRRANRSNPTQSNKDTYSFETILKDASLMDVLNFLKKDSALHFANQARFVSDTCNLYDMELCPHFFPPSECPDCRSVANPLDNQCDYEPDANEAEEDWIPMDSEVEASIIGMDPLHVRVVDAVERWYRHHAAEKLEYVKEAGTSYVEALSTHQDAVLKYTLSALGITASIYATFKLTKWLFSLKNTDPQGHEIKAPEILETDVPNPWKSVKPVSLPKTNASASTPADVLCQLLSHHLGHATLTCMETGKKRHCVVWPACQNNWVLPAHIMFPGEQRIEVQTTRKDTLGKNFQEIIDGSCWVQMDADFALVRLVSGGDVHNFSKYLLADDFDFTQSFNCDLVTKDMEGVVSIDTVKLQRRKMFESHFSKFDGVDYNCSKPCEPGICMSPLVARKRGATIVGFHLAGRNGTPYGVSGILTLPTFQRALNHLNSQMGLSCHSSGDFPTQRYDYSFDFGGTIDKRHPTRFQQDAEDGRQPVVDVIGPHTKGLVKFRSNVTKTIISDAVTEVMNLPRLHGAPDTRCINQHWSRDLTQMAHPRGDFIPRFWSSACDDLWRKFDSFLDANPKMLGLVHEYPHEYILSGMDGVTSVDRVDLNTSMGWPINKAKKNFIGPVEREVYGITEAVDFEDPKFMEGINEMRETLLKGERVYAIHRGNLKDEPTKFTKKKIRMFAGCEFALTYLGRQYYLPIIRLIQTNWLEFECAVGVNVHSRQWTQLYNHITKHGTANMVAGDYKAFDKSASPKAMMSSFELLIKIARKAGYSADQITIMRGIATEICYPVYEISGVMVQIFGSNPSGHPLTVIINNLMNSLYLRYAFYAIYDGKVPCPFDEACSLICYGDDNAMGVNDAYPDFNHTRISEELAKVGITYTMADKDSASVPFIGIEDVSFLKRNFKWSDDLQAWMAPIEVASISKSLHNCMKRKGTDVTPEELAIGSLSAANMEFYYHGKEVFEERRAQLLEVARQSGLERLVELKTYDDLTQAFLGRKSSTQVDFDDDIPLDMQCAKDESELIKKAKSDFGRKPVIEDCPMGCSMLGAPDLVFDFSDTYAGIIVCVETKILSNRKHSAASRLKFVRKQVRKYSKVISILREDAMVIGLTLTESGYNFVHVENPDSLKIAHMRKHLPLDHEEWEKLVMW